MKDFAYTQETLVIENLYKGLLDFINMQREKIISERKVVQ